MNQGGIYTSEKGTGYRFEWADGVIISVNYTASLFPKQVKKEQNKLSEDEDKSASPTCLATSKPQGLQETQVKAEQVEPSALAQEYEG
mgnify:CR=1 FL=1